MKRKKLIIGCYVASALLGGVVAYAIREDVRDPYRTQEEYISVYRERASTSYELDRIQFNLRYFRASNHEILDKQKKEAQKLIARESFLETRVNELENSPELKKERAHVRSRSTIGGLCGFGSLVSLLIGEFVRRVERYYSLERR